MERSIWIAFVCICCIFAASSVPFKKRNKADFDEIERKIVERILYLYKTNSTYAKLYDKWMKDSEPVSNNTFPCDRLPPSAEVPTSVHKLRPGDVKVVGAVGDSLTAGRGASLGVVGLLYDFPELSWSAGGRRSYAEQVTLPNILRQYSPYIRGAAESRYERGLNMAITGAESDQEMSEILDLVAAIRADEKIDFDNDWKVITVFIGANDLCAICDNYEDYSPDQYIKNVQSGLDYLHDNLPRTFVNLVEVLNIEMVQELGKTVICNAVHVYACDCAAFPKDKAAEEKVVEFRKAYQEKLRELVASGRYDTKQDFTVVLQPFYRETFPPYLADGELDLSYFASDCFHESSKGQQNAAKALWNNMVEPVGSKRLDWHPSESLECPTEEKPYFYTALNSQ